ncbi:polymorphic toxin type 50 domain-containing protein [Cytobacillus kochii]|nr:polymorphic toxin type 50 domain-containing protein [Cytobacillus kochii]
MCAVTGEVERGSSGKRNNKEFIMTDNVLEINGFNGEPAKGLKILHSKTRTHVVPFKGGIR